MTFVRIARRLLSITAFALPLSAMAYPDKPIEWVVPYAAGGGSDVLARVLAEAMSKTLGQSEREKWGQVIRASNIRLD